MTWTPPKTWQTGDLVTANDLNTHLRDNLLALKAARLLGSLSYNANYSTTSQSWVNVDATNLNLTVVTRGGLLLIGMRSVISMSSGSRVGQFDLALDGARQGGTNGLFAFKADADGGAYSFHQDIPASFLYLKQGVAAGNHSVTLQWRVGTSGDTTTTFSIDSSASGGMPTSLWVMEFDH
ncbi:MAG: hypothetical protein ACOYL5_14075 [Phototrophicaceae bacterium]|jgi:hypothetical protein